jgi:hypothetical protein
MTFTGKQIVWFLIILLLLWGDYNLFYYIRYDYKTFNNNPTLLMILSLCCTIVSVIGVVLYSIYLIIRMIESDFWKKEYKINFNFKNKK